MRLLMLGGTGLISSACATLARERGHELTLVTRGRATTFPPPPGARLLICDASDPRSLRSTLERNALGERFDAVIQFVAFEPWQIPDDVVTFAPRTQQYLFISTAAAYPPSDRFAALNETREQGNPFWSYAAKKAECERELHHYAEAAGLPFTIIRPAHTYGVSRIPGYVGNSEHPWTLPSRMRRGADIIVPGDGTTVWTLTHARDVAMAILDLLGNARAFGKAINVTSDEALTWEAIHREIALASGLRVEQYEQQVVHVPSDAIVALFPESEGMVRGDKMHNKVTDVSLLRNLAPNWRPRTTFAQGIRESVQWFLADSARQTVDARADAAFDRLGAVYRTALGAAYSPNQ
jgi:nucleoside-diphosphate-sugar epimerase